MTDLTIVVIGGSSGALEALQIVVAGLPADLASAIFVVIHTAPNSPGVLDRILSRVGTLPARYAVDGESIRPGHIYLASPDRHLLVKPSHVRVTRGPRENRFRPAIDPLFRTAAASYGPRVIGVVLSGGQDDGAMGLAAIKHVGGVALVQDPAEALVASMPEASIRHVDVDHVLSAKDMPTVLCGLIRERLERPEMPMTKHPPRDIAEGGAHDIHHANDLGPPSPFTCPDCGGTLWQSREGELLRFQCHLGHRYTADSLVGAQDDALDQALWAALRALEENTELRRRMARHAEGRGMSVIAKSYDEQASESEQRASVIRRALMPEARNDEPAQSEPTEADGVSSTRAK